MPEEYIGGEVVYKTDPPKAAEPEVKVEVKTEGTESKAAVEPDAHEERARSSGWKPKEEWEGKPEDWRDARTYNDRGELLGKIKSTSQELARVRESIAALSEHNKKVYTAGYEKAINDLRAQKAIAIENNDGKAVIQIEAAIETQQAGLKQVQTAEPAAVETISPAFESFLEQNPWYNDRPGMKAWSHGEAIAFAKSAAGKNATEAQVYEHIAQEVRKEYPERFKRSAPPSPDGEGRTSGGKPSTKGSTVAFEKVLAQLPEDQARAARDFVKRGLMTAEKYVQDYESIGQGR